MLIEAATPIILTGILGILLCIFLARFGHILLKVNELAVKKQAQKVKEFKESRKSLQFAVNDMESGVRKEKAEVELNNLINTEIKMRIKLGVLRGSLTTLRLWILTLRILSTAITAMGATTLLALFGASMAILAVVAIITSEGYTSGSPTSNSPKTEKVVDGKKLGVHGEVPNSEEERVVWVSKVLLEYEPNLTRSQLVGIVTHMWVETGIDPRKAESDYLNPPLGKSSDADLDNPEWLSSEKARQLLLASYNASGIPTHIIRRGIGLLQWTDSGSSNVTEPVDSWDAKRKNNTLIGASYGHSELLEYAESKGGKWHDVGVQMSFLVSGTDQKAGLWKEYLSQDRGDQGNLENFGRKWLGAGWAWDERYAKLGTVRQILDKEGIGK